MRANALLRLTIGLSLPVLLLAGLLVVTARDRAEAAGSGPDLAISIDVDGGGDDCDTNAGTPGIGTMCTVSVGGMFTVKGHVLGFVGISGAGGYGGISMRFVHSAGLTLNQRSGTSEMMWPDCGGATESKPASAYEAVCHDFSAPPASMYKGKVLEVDYTCTTSGSKTVTMQDANTFLFDSTHAVAADAEGDEVLTINCAAAVGGIAELPAIAGSPAAAADQTSSGNNMLLAIAGLVSVTVLAGGALCYARARVR